MLEPLKYEGDINLLKYVLHILSDSRTKNRAQNRIEGLLRIRLEETSNCVVYTKEMINDYAGKKQGN